MAGEDFSMEGNSLRSLPVKLEVFEGPLDLLLHLIRESKVDIADIPIAAVTEQYLGYLELMKTLNLDVAGEFLVMAATLMHIKSRMLLPVEEEQSLEEGEDPRQELVRQLQEYQKFKEAALALGDLEEKRSRVFVRRSIGPEEPKRTDYPIETSLFELLTALKSLLDKVPETEPLEFRADQLSIAEKITEILERLSELEGEVAFEDLFRRSREREEIIITFLALLELMYLRMVRAWQAVPGGRIMMTDIRPAGEQNGGGDEEEVAGGESDVAGPDDR